MPRVDDRVQQTGEKPIQHLGLLFFILNAGNKVGLGGEDEFLEGGGDAGVEDGVGEEREVGAVVPGSMRYMRGAVRVNMSVTRTVRLQDGPSRSAPQENRRPLSPSLQRPAIRMLLQ